MRKELIEEVPTYTVNRNTMMIDAEVWGVMRSGERKLIRQYAITRHILEMNARSQLKACEEFDQIAREAPNIASFKAKD